MPVLLEKRRKNILKLKNTNIQFESVIGDLIETRRKELGLSKLDVIQRLGYVNISKGYRRYDAFFAGNIEQRFFLDNLASALCLQFEKISSALEKTRLSIRQAEQFDQECKLTEWRKAFKAHGIIETESSVPQPIFTAIFTDVLSRKLIELDITCGAETYRQQMMEEIPNRVGDNGTIISFGAPIGFVINYSPDHAIRYDLNGVELQEMNAALRLGEAFLSFKNGKRINDAAVVEARDC